MGRGVTIWHPVAETSKVSADQPAPAWLTTTRYLARILGNFRGFCTNAPTLDTGRTSWVPGH